MFLTRKVCIDNLSAVTQYYFSFRNLKCRLGAVLFVLVTGFILEPDVMAGQTIKTLDGVEIGDRSRLVRLCVKGADDKKIEFNGISFSAKSYCSCVIDNVFPTILSEEILRAMQYDNIMEVLLRDDNFRFGLSYDYNLTKIGQTYGVYEFSVTYLTRCRNCYTDRKRKR